MEKKLPSRLTLAQALSAGRLDDFAAQAEAYFRGYYVFPVFPVFQAGSGLEARPANA